MKINELHLWRGLGNSTVALAGLTPVPELSKKPHIESKRNKGKAHRPDFPPTPHPSLEKKGAKEKRTKHLAGRGVSSGREGLSQAVLESSISVGSTMISLFLLPSPHGGWLGAFPSTTSVPNVQICGQWVLLIFLHPGGTGGEGPRF